MDDSLRVAQERIRRFEQLGGVSLSRLDPEEQWNLKTEVHLGTALYKKAVFTFVCPMCGKVESADQEMEPMCTGPSWTDDHEPMVMTRKQDARR